jgi:hypothetical protein
MYLHKDGCEFYKVMFEYITLHTKSITNNDISVDSVTRVGQYNVLEKLEKLHEHLKDSLEHINSENNVLKNFAENINAHIGKFTDPKTAELFKILQDMNNLGDEFKSLNINVEEALTLMKNSSSSKEGRNLLTLYNNISAHLNNIYQMSRRLATDLFTLIKSLEKVQELIKKEEAVATDFQKNMMSWF